MLDRIAACIVRPMASQTPNILLIMTDQERYRGRFVAVANFAGLSGVMMSEAVVDPVLDAIEWTIVSQALPMPASRDCADVVDADYAWGTGFTGGWRRGWEPWVATFGAVANG